MVPNLLDRATSGFPLSISTGLAFESLFPPRQAVYDPNRAIPKQVDIRQYTQLWINMDTLFRNMLDAGGKIAVSNTGYKETSTVLYDEMETIANMLANEGQGFLTPVFYSCDYQHALASIPRAFSLRQHTLPGQMLIENLRKKTMKELGNLRSDIKSFSTGIRIGVKERALILTHQPYDLLAKRFFGKLDLLESNTGRLKTSLTWNTKYYPIPDADMKILPFNRPLLMALGDKPLIQPWPLKIRRQIMETAVRGKWTPLTTLDKVMLDLRLTLHPMEFGYLRMLKTNA